jgi:OHCU decarboxylase
VLNELNDIPHEQAEERLYSCFASHRWARRIADGRPYPDLQSLLAMADQAWSELEPAEWEEALAGHPRIGERGGSSPLASEREQRGVRSAAAETLADLAEENRRYEARFGHVFLIAAAGLEMDEILAALRERMSNDPVTEASVAATEHRKIARRRLEELFRA